MSCLARQAKILVAEAEENNKVSQWHRRHTCSLCEQKYHGVVKCALGWACWKTHLGRSETDQIMQVAMNVLGNGLSAADHDEDALCVQEAELLLMRRLGASEGAILSLQSNLAVTYRNLGRPEALQMNRDVYSGWLKFKGEEHKDTLLAANNYASLLGQLNHFKEAKLLLRKTVPVARRVLGESDEITLRLRSTYAGALCQDDDFTLDDLRETVTTLEEIEPTARRVFGGAHPLVGNIGRNLENARAGLRDNEGDVDALREAVAALGK